MYIWPFHAGYEAGARSVDPDIEVLYEYLGEFPDLSGFGDPARAEEAASRLYEAGADVVFHAAGDSGVGVFEAATDLSTDDREALGDRCGQRPVRHRAIPVRRGPPGGMAQAHPHVGHQASRHRDVRGHRRLHDRASLPPGKITFDLASRAVDISYSGRYLDDVFSQIEDARAQINDGTVIVPCVPSDRRRARSAGGVQRRLLLALTNDRVVRRIERT